MTNRGRRRRGTDARSAAVVGAAVLAMILGAASASAAQTRDASWLGPTHVTSGAGPEHLLQPATDRAYRG